jgi:hypothetical protein
MAKAELERAKKAAVAIRTRRVKVMLFFSLFVTALELTLNRVGFGKRESDLFMPPCRYNEPA